METFGYIRVSTTDQNIDRQVIALREAGVRDDQMYIDHWSGKDFARPAYREMVAKFQPGDLLVVLSVDRLGRNYREMLSEWHRLVHERGINIQVLDMPALATKNKDSLTEELIADIMLQLQSYVAETERHFILARQSEGIAAARTRGVVFGRPCFTVPAIFFQLKTRWEKKEVSSRAAAEILNISHVTFLRWVKKY